PVAAMGGAGLAALSEQDKRLSNTGIAAIQAGATGLLANLGIKYAVGRARPEDGKGPADFEPFKRPASSFPSNHTTVTWAATTTTPPAYAGAPPHARRGKNVRVFSPPFLRRGGCEAAGVVVLALVLCASSLSAQAQPRCLVLDPELQDSYSGGCKDGKAEGQ